MKMVRLTDLLATPEQEQVLRELARSAARGELASGNAVLVERAVEIIEAIGEKVATVDEPRAILNLAG